MAIDPLQHRAKEMFANYGLTVYAVQQVEKTLVLLLAGVECRDQGKDSAKDLQAWLREHKRLIVTSTIKALKKKLRFPPDLEAELDEAFKQRNEVIHHFFFERFDGHTLTRSPEHMSQELRPIRDRFNRLHDRLDELFEQI